MNLQNNIIVKESAKTMRAMARQTLRGRWMEAFLICLAMYAISTLPSMIVPYVSDTAFALSTVNIYALAVSGPMTLGISIYFLKLFRQSPAGVEDLLRGFSYMWKSFVLLILIAVRVFLFSLLLVIPGILAALRYSQAFFILADDPAKTPRQCIWESSAMMRGNCGKFFLLALSFIGWGILASLPSAFWQFFWGPAPVELMFQAAEGWEEILRASLEAAAGPVHPFVYIMGLATVLLGVYITTAQACFYDLVNGNLQVRREGQNV